MIPLLRSAVELGNACDPYEAGKIIYVSAGDQTTIPPDIVPQLITFERAVSDQRRPSQ